MMGRTVSALAFALFTNLPRKHDHQCPTGERGHPIESMCIAEKPWRGADRHEDEGITQDLPPCFLCSSNYGEHRKSSTDIVVDANERQRPEMRRCPEEDNEEQKTRFDRQTARRCRPADDGRQRAGGTTDDDILRSQALEPCRVDNDVKKDREGKERRREPVYQQTEHGHGECGEHDAEGERLAGGDAPPWNWTARGAAHQSIYVCVVPHVKRTRRPGADRDAQERREADHRMDVSRR